LLLAGLLFIQTSSEADTSVVVREFVGKYCLECHDARTHKGDRELESFALPLKAEADLVLAKDIVDQLTLREMPPKKAAQPTDEERLAVSRAVRDAINTARGQIQSARVDPPPLEPRIRKYACDFVWASSGHARTHS
jgi:hypothetical protein